MMKSVLISLLTIMLMAPLAHASDGQFAPCTSADLETLQQLESGYEALLVQGTRTRNVNLLRYLVERQYEWRLGLNDGLPRCAEAFEIGWLMSQLTGDAVAVAAMDLADKDFGWMLDLMEIGGTRMAALLEDLAAALDGGSLTSLSLDDVAAACSDEQLAILAPDIVIAFQDVGAMALAVTTPDEFADYAIAYITLRDVMWDNLPHCNEAVEFGLMMNQILGDFLALFLHGFIPVADEDNSVKPQLEGELDRFAGKMEEVVTALDRKRTVKIYYVTAESGANIRACPTTSCDILTVFENGQEMRIIDDSGEWYEIRFDNGETGFIAGFLASMNPQS